MKRYWFMLLLAPLIAAGVSSYYIQASVKVNPDFVLERLSGDEQAVAGVTLEGNYGFNEIRKSVSITSKGSIVKGGQTLYKSLAFNLDGMDELAQRYPGFMRGKRNISELYENADQIVYAGIMENKDAGGFRFEVQEMGKQDHEVTGLQAPVPNGKLYQQMFVNDVQLAGGQLILSVMAYRSGNMEPHLYTIDLLGKQEPKEAAWSDVFHPGPEEQAFLTSTANNSLQPSRYIACIPMLSNRFQVEDGRNVEPRMGKGQLLIYDVQEGREIKVNSKVVDDFLTLGGKGSFQQLELDGDSLYLVKSTVEGLKTLQYRIPEGQAVERTILMNDADSFYQVKGHVLYMFNRTGKGDAAGQHPQTLTATDLQTGNILYEGAITVRTTDSISAQAFRSLSMHSILIH